MIKHDVLWQKNKFHTLFTLYALCYHILRQNSYYIASFYEQHSIRELRYILQIGELLVNSVY